jgi:hypothetical protein
MTQDTTTLPPSKPLLIGLTGRAGAGKSTVASMLADYAFVEVAFADPIVDMVGALFALAGVDGAWMVERSLKEQPTVLGVSYRQLAQTIGTEIGRQITADFWVRVMHQRLQALELRDENVVISDVRFPNEADWIRERGGYLVRVLRHDLPAVRPHSSEAHTDLLPVTTELLNFGSLSTLHDQVERLVQTLRS